MNKEQLESRAYGFYESLIGQVLSTTLDNGGCLTYKEAIKKSTTERDLLEKEKKSLITKILGKLGIGSPLYKHSPVPYDMALCLMKILNKDSFVKQDYDYLWNNKDIYERYFRNNLLAFQEFRYSYDVDSLSKEEYALKQRKQIELFEKAVPPLGKMEIENEIEKEQ